jgi:hypothetical protein
MMPEKHISHEPEDSPIGDRRFSDLQEADRWRLVREAITDHARISDYWRRLLPVGFILAVSVEIEQYMFAHKHVSVSFRLWFFFQVLLILVLLLFGWVFDYLAQKRVHEIAHILSGIEDLILESRGSGED